MPITTRQILDAKTLIEVNTLIELDKMNQIIDDIYAHTFFELISLRRTLKFEVQMMFRYGLKE